jgi:hypothetical protein
LAAELSRIFSTPSNLEGQKSRLILALQQIICAIRTVMKDEIIKEGYACIGQSLFCFKTIMSKCTTTIPDALPALSVYFSQEVLDRHNFMSINDQTLRNRPKDQRIYTKKKQFF